MEATDEVALASVALSHLSIEVGHLYFDEFRKGMDFLRKKFELIAPWVSHAGSGARRVSTCYLVDDYFARLDPPGEVIPKVLAAAEAAGVGIDYLARESACAAYGDVEVAPLVVDWIVDEPPEKTNGVRPPLKVTGWLSNGERTPDADHPAMKDVSKPAWEPAREIARNRHSIFIDIELWSEEADGRLWSCPLLAAVWQLTRLGLLRSDGQALLQPQSWTAPWPDDWSALPAVVKLNNDAKPFSAYHSLSVLDDRFLPIEHAVRTILGQVAIDASIVDQIRDRAKAEKVILPADLLGRIGYVFGRYTAPL